MSKLNPSTRSRSLKTRIISKSWRQQYVVTTRPGLLSFIACTFGFHRWSDWSGPKPAREFRYDRHLRIYFRPTYNVRTCARCGHSQSREVL